MLCHRRKDQKATHPMTSIDLSFCYVFWFMWIYEKKKCSSAWLLLVQHIVCCVIVCVGSWALSLSSFSPVSLSSFSLSLSILDTRGVGRGLQSFLINAWLWFQGDGVLTWHAYCLGICNQGPFVLSHRQSLQWLFFLLKLFALIRSFSL